MMVVFCRGEGSVKVEYSLDNIHETYRGGGYLGEMVRFCKEELDIESVTVVTNGSKVVLQEIHPM